MPKIETKVWMDEYNYYKISHQVGDVKALVTVKEFLDPSDLRQLAADCLEAADVIASQEALDKSDVEEQPA